MAKSAKKPLPQDSAQHDRFREAARDLECDQDEGRWNERLKKVAQQKPVPEKPE